MTRRQTKQEIIASPEYRALTAEHTRLEGELRAMGRAHFSAAHNGYQAALARLGEVQAQCRALFANAR